MQPVYVEPAKKMDPIAAGAPKPAANLTPGISKYNAKLEIQGQSIPLTVTTEIKEAGNSWTVTETAVTPQGDVIEVATVEKGSLLLTHRSIKQGGMTIEFDVKNNKASGTMISSGQSRPIAVDLDGALFADGAGAYNVIAALPLAEGYSVGFRNLDVMKQKTQDEAVESFGLRVNHRSSRHVSSL